MEEFNDQKKPWLFKTFGDKVMIHFSEWCIFYKEQTVKDFTPGKTIRMIILKGKSNVG